MAFSEQDRVYIRRYLGFSAIFLQADPRLEAAVTAVQSETDGGSRPDANTENEIKGLIYGTVAQGGNAVTLGPAAQNVQFAMPATHGLIAIDQLLATMWPIAFAVNADGGEARIDTYRAMIQLRTEGRRLVHRMAKMLATLPRSDVFASGDTNPGGDTFYDLPDGSGSNYQW